MADFRELVAAVRREEPGAMLELWEAVRRYVEMKARDRASNAGSRVSADDLIQAGFLAVVDVVEKYDSERESGSFWAVLNYALKTRFSEEYGTRTTKRDALQYADSLDIPAFEDEQDGATIADYIPDDLAALAFTGVEYDDFLVYCRGIINAALETITPTQADAMRRHFLEGLTMKQAGELRGSSSNRSATSATGILIKSGARYLRRGSYAARLRECLDAFDDFRTYESAARGGFFRTGTSTTEAAALVNVGSIRRSCEN